MFDMAGVWVSSVIQGAGKGIRALDISLTQSNNNFSNDGLPAFKVPMMLRGVVNDNKVSFEEMFSPADDAQKKVADVTKPSERSQLDYRPQDTIVGAYYG